ncbi:hypothetical protein AX14_000559 [Amanita brunnescens Koide BX004]|nr:hypothetical protein AX14_000559 [Amanita brunnescens Koide BX004]
MNEVWMDFPEEEKVNLASQVAEIIHTMRTNTAFSMIGKISPDGSACPLVDDIDFTNGREVVDGLGLYNVGQLVL